MDSEGRLSYKMFRFRLATVLLFVALIGVGFAWWIDRSSLRDEIDQIDRHDSVVLLDALEFADDAKFYQFSPSVYLHTDCATIEDSLADYVQAPTGDYVISTQGWSLNRLRRPTIETTDAVVSLLDHNDNAIRKRALQLFALYSEAYLSTKDNDETVLARTYFRESATIHLFAMLNDPDPEIRGLVALAIGNACPWRSSIENLSVAYKRETDPIAKLYIAWAIAQQTHRNHER